MGKKKGGWSSRCQNHAVSIRLRALDTRSGIVFAKIENIIKNKYFKEIRFLMIWWIAHKRVIETIKSNIKQ